jgi:hypothetical protein
MACTPPAKLREGRHVTLARYPDLILVVGSEPHAFHPEDTSPNPRRDSIIISSLETGLNCS